MTSARRALVLGGTGLVGRAIALRLARAGWRVDVTGRQASNMPAELVDAGVSFIRADSRDAAELVPQPEPVPTCSSTAWRTRLMTRDGCCRSRVTRHRR